jgi:hypothetical protein
VAEALKLVNDLAKFKSCDGNLPNLGGLGDKKLNVHNLSLSNT